MTTTRAAELNNGIVTSWIPLTTPGPTFSAQCSSALYYMLGMQDPFIAGFDPYYGLSIEGSVTCLATEQTEWWFQSNSPATTFQLGPFACPSEYTTATIRAINSITTEVACCPSGYTFGGTILDRPSNTQCFQVLTKGQQVTPLTSILGSGSFTSTTVTVGDTPLSIHGVQVNGYIFAQTSSTGSPTSGSGASATTPTSSPSSSSYSYSSTTITSSDGLSSGAKIGIGLGVSLGFIAICCAITAFLIYRRRQRLRAASSNQPPFDHQSPLGGPVPLMSQNGYKHGAVASAKTAQEYPPQHLPGQFRPGPKSQYERTEAPTVPMAEMQATAPHSEVMGDSTFDRPPVEMSG